MPDVLAQLRERALEAEGYAQHLESLLESFWTGNVPQGASFDHMILAKWGRKRLEEKVKTPALLQSGT